VNYYERTSGTNSDGTATFASPCDLAKQAEVAALVESAFGPGLELKEFGRLCPIDYYAVRHGRMSSVLEIKSRTHDAARYPTVFLNVRKWLALQMASIGFGVPAYFVVQFTDLTKYIEVSLVDASRHRIAGTSHVVKSKSDIEPVIEVPIESMKAIAIGGGR
jgi:hypothetical protein